MTIKRVVTGIKGLDELIEGGIPEGASILVTGTPGAAKSTLGMHFIVNGALAGEKGVYLSMEEEPESLIEQGERLGMPLKKLVDSKKIMLLKLNINLIQGEEAIKKLLDPEFLIKLKGFGVKRIVLDSLSLALHLSHNYQLGPRGATASLMEGFKSLGCTSLFIHEREKTEEHEIHYGFHDFIADGILYMQLIRKRDTAEFYRAITILKMRKTNHGKGVYPFHIEKDGLKIYPDQKVF